MKKRRVWKEWRGKEEGRGKKKGGERRREGGKEEGRRGKGAGGMYVGKEKEGGTDKLSWHWSLMNDDHHRDLTKPSSFLDSPTNAPNSKIIGGE